ncbi:MAG TPA: alkaline phosphatase D family protein [Solirubrobacterales bacterium]|nr:alkaline phosphatase D family protein [Solirubrobacterales bacterium]
MSDLVLGPLLRHISETDATVWVETSEPCEVEVLGCRERTFRVDGHHYALVCIEGLEPASRYEYEVRLDGEVRWPEPGSELPPSAIRTTNADRELDICFGSCRVAVPHEAPFTEPKDETEMGHEVDALWVLARQMAAGERDDWPELLFLLGDQVYVDEGSPKTREKIRQRRGTATPPGDEVTDFEEYTWLYQESWEEPLIRWLFSNVAVSMLWDDHDMSDDWNISYSWLEEMRERSWWHRRAVGCIASYWIYQHLGNLSPRELAEDELYQRVRGNQWAEEELFAWAQRIDSTGAGTRWSFCRDFGRTRAIFIDSRAGRVLEEDRRAIVDDEEWEWIVDKTTGDFDHLLIATTVPWLLSPAFDRLEAWDEKVADGAWGKPLARAAELLRREVDFDHWAAFGESFAKLRDLLREVASGERGKAPASIVVLSGDVHHAYLCEAAYPKANGKTAGPRPARSPIYQAVCSPYRNPLDENERRVVRAAFRRPAIAFARLLARAAGAPDPGIRWRALDGPFFDNQVATLELDGRAATMRLDKTVPGEDGTDALEESFSRRLA